MALLITALGALVALTIWVISHPTTTSELLPAGPVGNETILRLSGLASSLGAAPIRAAVLAVALASLAAARRWHSLAYVLVAVQSVHLVDRLFKAAVGRPRLLDPERSYALSPWLRVTIILTILALGAWLLRRGWPPAALWVPPALLGIGILSHVVTAVPVLAGADSYPSGHAANTMALVAALGVARPVGRRWNASLSWAPPWWPRLECPA